MWIRRKEFERRLRLARSEGFADGVKWGMVGGHVIHDLLGRFGIKPAKPKEPAK